MLHCLSTSNFRLPISNNTTPKKQRFRNRGLFHFTAMEKSYQEKKPRLLCLHGFRTSGEILKKQVSKWPDSVMGKLDLVFLDGPFPAQGKSDVEGFFPPPYYEWFQFISEVNEYRNVDECLAYVEDFMLKQGPFDCLMGFSQGAILSTALTSLQSKGLALTKVPKVKCLIIIGGGKFRSSDLCEKVYSSPIECPSLHLIGDADFLKPRGELLLESFMDPIVIRHSKGHVVPKLDDESLVTVLDFVERIQKILSRNAPATTEENEAHSE
eukprot:TRINITY_DN19735_c0_g2_i1.p1 TRINITY_DN19735_c0_g2~~TRINITY_DN19735_c0_g2_i1.p1  ORF type:complete len:268 (-),score=34.28 TRINITY_DN19735_c0_g2_i1:1276-2079(-)